MKMDPATAAAAPAALVSPVAVIVMTTPGSGAGRVSGDGEDARNRIDEATSHDDVTLVVISPVRLCLVVSSRGRGLQQVQLACAADRAAPGVDVELGEDVPGVGPERVDGHEQPAGDLGAGQIGRQQPEHLDLSLAQRILATKGWWGRV